MGQPTRWGGHSGTSHTGTDAAAACRGTAPVHAHGSEQLQTRREQTSEDPRDPHLGEKGLQLVMHWCFRWVMGKTLC